MNITATRREDLLRERDDYDNKTQAIQKKVDEGEERYENEIYSIAKTIEKNLSEMIGPSTIDLQIKVDPWGKYGENAFGVEVTGNYRDIFNKSKALSWRWEAYINKGEVVKESSSYSGLQAITAEQIADLEESLRIFKILNNIDWDAILKTPKPGYGDFVSKDDRSALRDRKANRPKFEDELATLDLEDFVGSDTAIKLQDDNYYRDPYILLTGLTDKFAKGYVVPGSWLDSYTMSEIINKVDERRVARHKLVRSRDSYTTKSAKKA